VRAMLDLALCSQEKPVNLKDMAARQDVSADYLEQLLRKLRKAGLVRSIRGPRGGFLLARAPGEIVIWDIVNALEDEMAPVYCVDEVIGRKSRRKPCDRMSDCATHLLWAGLARQMRAFLESRTLQDLAGDAVSICSTATRGSPLMFSI
jgi:Rrf2 family protein